MLIIYLYFVYENFKNKWFYFIKELLFEGIKSIFLRFTKAFYNL